MALQVDRGFVKATDCAITERWTLLAAQTLSWQACCGTVLASSLQRVVCLFVCSMPEPRVAWRHQDRL